MATVPEVSLDRKALCAVDSQCRGDPSQKNKGYIGIILATVRLWQQRIKQRQALCNLSDALLRDVGITRWSAEQEAAKWFWQE